MDTTLVINPGSASKKYELYANRRNILSVSFERLGEDFSKCISINTARHTCDTIDKATYERALKAFIVTAIHEGRIGRAKDITRVGVRIVAPGTYFTLHREITEGYIERLRRMERGAPLHIPHILHELDVLHGELPHAYVLGVSDSAFHTTMPPHTHCYSIRREDGEEYDVYRFGYHGLSVSSVVEQIRQRERTIPRRMVVCHLGSGVSVTTLLEGKSIDTTMGFSPASGLMMNTRAGNVDPGALLYLMEKKSMSPQEALVYVNSEGGLLGIVGQSDLRIALDRMVRGDMRAEMAVTMYIHGIRKAIGGAIATLGGIDMLVLTGTAAERNALVRALVSQNLEGLGIVLDPKKNEAHTDVCGFIHREKKSVPICVMHTEEMREIARITDGAVN